MLVPGPLHDRGSKSEIINMTESSGRTSFSSGRIFGIEGGIFDSKTKTPKTKV
jgi:hypothetical protein